jgi:hypothetical protein
MRPGGFSKTPMGPSAVHRRGHGSFKKLPWYRTMYNRPKVPKAVLLNTERLAVANLPSLISSGMVLLRGLLAGWVGGGEERGLWGSTGNEYNCSFSTAPRPSKKIKIIKIIHATFMQNNKINKYKRVTMLRISVTFKGVKDR